MREPLPRTIVNTAFIAMLAMLSLCLNGQKMTAQSSRNTPVFKINPWTVVDSNLADLLNSGWKLVGQSSHRIATVTGGGIGAIDEETFVYTLTRNGKYVTCFLQNPIPNKGAYGGCRLIN
jgi:hypothetical protein